MSQGDINITVVGNLTDNPELKFVPSGNAVTQFTIASNKKKYENGKWVDGETTYMRCELWRAEAENFCKTASKGMRVIATGVLRQSSYENRNGEKRTIMIMQVRDIGPSLKFATATVNRVDYQNNAGGNQWQSSWQQTPPAGGFAQQQPDQPPF